MQKQNKISVRQIFSEAQLRQIEYDQPLIAKDDHSGITLSYRFNGLFGQLLFTGDNLASPVSVGVDESDINLISTLIIDGLKHQ